MQFQTSTTAALVMLLLAVPAFSEPLDAASSTTSAISSAQTVVTRPLDDTPTHIQNSIPNHNMDGNVQHGLEPHSNEGNSDVSDKTAASKLVKLLKAYHTQVELEFKVCAAQNGVNKCLSRELGPMPEPDLTGSALKDALLKYHNTLGKELAECTKASKDLKGCMKKSTAKGDKFQKRDVKGFFEGFVQGFTGVFQAAVPILTQVAAIL